MRGLSDRETRIYFMIFPSTLNREAAFRLPLSLRTDCRRCHSGAGYAHLRCLRFDSRELHESQLAHEYIVVPNNIHSRTAIKPACRLVYDRRLGRVSSASFEVIRFRSDSLRLDWS